MALNVSAENVFNRARALLNDRTGSIWPDSALSEYFKDAVNWLYTSIIEVSEPTKTTSVSGDLVYTHGNPGEEQSLAPIQPADLYYPTAVYFRESSALNWTPLDQVDTLPTDITNPYPDPFKWTFRNRVIWLVSGSVNGLLRIEYVPLLPTPAGDASDQILMDNAIEALAAYTAALASIPRGQAQQSAMLMGRASPTPVGALGYREMILNILTKREQGIARRGVGFSDDRGVTGYEGQVQI